MSFFSMLKHLLVKYQNRRRLAYAKKFADVGKNCLFRKGFSIQPLHAGGKISFGDHNCISGNWMTYTDSNISVGNNVFVGVDTYFMAKEKITIGDNVIIANNALIMDNNNHPVLPSARLEMSQCDDYLTDELWSWKNAKSAPVTIENNVWIGRDTRILKGVTVGESSIVALGAVVVHDVPPYSVVAGNPAQVVKELPRP